MSYEYKCVGAPERPKRQRGARSRSDRVAVAMQEIIAAEAVDGWEYLRTDLVPVEEKNGFFSRAHEVHRAVLVFRRALEPVTRPAPADRVRATRELPAETDQREPAPERPAAAPERAAEPKVEAREPRGEDRSARGEGREGRIALSADRDEPPRPPRSNRPPSGLG